MSADQAKALRTGQAVRWVLADWPEAKVIDLHPANPHPAVQRGRLVRIGWRGVNAERPATDVLAWTDDLLLVR